MAAIDCADVGGVCAANRVKLQPLKSCHYGAEPRIQNPIPTNFNDDEGFGFESLGLTRRALVRNRTRASARQGRKNSKKERRFGVDVF